MVDEYVAWYDRHLDPAWQDVVLTPPDAQGDRVPVGLRRCRRAPAICAAMGRCFSATTFLSAGNITHTPAYGNLIALGILDAVQQRNVSPEQIAAALPVSRRRSPRTGRFLTFCAGAATIGARMRPDPAERVRAAARARDRCRASSFAARSACTRAPPTPRTSTSASSRRGSIAAASRDLHRAGRCARRHRALPQDLRAPPEPVHRPAEQPLRRARRPDVARRRLRAVGARLPDGRHRPSRWPRGSSGTSSTAGSRRRSSRSGLALACTHAMGLKEHEPTIDYLVDLVVDVQTVRTCLTAAELDPEVTAAGLLHSRTAATSRAGSIAMLKARQRMTEILRILPGSSLVVAPSDTDLAAPEIGGRARGVVRAAAGTPRCSARPCSSSPRTTSPPRSTGASRRSSCTPTAASRRGGGGSAATSAATTSWPTASCAR